MSKIAKIFFSFFLTISIWMATCSVRLNSLRGAIFNRQWHFTCNPWAYWWPTWSCQRASWLDVAILLTLTTSQKQESRWEKPLQGTWGDSADPGRAALAAKKARVFASKRRLSSPPEAWKWNCLTSQGYLYSQEHSLALTHSRGLPGKLALHSDTAAWASTGW